MKNGTSLESNNNKKFAEITNNLIDKNGITNFMNGLSTLHYITKHNDSYVTRGGPKHFLLFTSKK